MERCKILFILITFLLIGCEEGTIESQEKSIDINGVWKDSCSSHTKNATMILSEKNGKVRLTHYLEWKGQRFVEYGIGTRTGNTLLYDVKVTLPIEGWATEGTHSLTISEDGDTLRGTYVDTKNSGPMVFSRVR